MQKLSFIDCVDLLRRCVEVGLIRKDPKRMDNIIVYFSASKEYPEGWYSQNMLTAAGDLFGNVEAQNLIINKLKGIGKNMIFSKERMSEAIKVLKEAGIQDVASVLEDMVADNESTDIELLNRKHYFATVLWNKKDIQMALSERIQKQYAVCNCEAPEELVNKVLAVLNMDVLENCEYGWNAINTAILEAEQSGSIHPGDYFKLFSYEELIDLFYDIMDEREMDEQNTQIQEKFSEAYNEIVQRCKKMSDDELQDQLTDIIIERAEYPEDSMDLRALTLDNLHMELSKEISGRKVGEGL